MVETIKLSQIKTINQLREEIENKRNKTFQLNILISKKMQRIEKLQKEIRKIEEKKDSNRTDGLNGNLHLAEKYNAEAIGNYNGSLTLKINNQWAIPTYKTSDLENAELITI